MKKCNKKKIEKKRIETTKKLLIFVDVLLTISVVLTFVGWMKGFEPSSMVTLDISLVGLTTAMHSFYVWKAKHENCQKNVDVNAFIQQYGVEAYKAMTTDTTTY